MTKPFNLSQHLARSAFNVLDFGAKGDGVADDTVAWVEMFGRMQATGHAGYVPAGDYLVRTGAIEWTFDNSITVEAPGPAGPTLHTSGKVRMLAKAGSPDAPFISIHNDPVNGSRFVNGGYVGPIQFVDTTPEAAPNRHGISLYGVQFMRFGAMSSFGAAGTFVGGLKGDLFHVVAKGAPTTADAWHVYSCTFESGTTWNTQGWTFNNDSVSQVFNGNYIGALWNISGAKGLFRGPGAANTIDFVSTYNCAGYALILIPDVGTVQRLVINGGELDAPENGIAIAGLQLADLKGIRVTHRRAGGVTHPATALVLHDGDSGQVNTDINIQLHHRIDATVTAEAQLGTICTFNNDSTTNRVKIDQTYTIGATPAFTPAASLFKVGIPAALYGNLITLNGKPIHDSTIKNALRATITAPLVLSNANGYGSLATKLAFDAPTYDDGGNFDAVTGCYIAPHTGFYHVKGQIRLTPTADQLNVRMSVMTHLAGVLSFIAEDSIVGSGVASQTFSVDIVERFTAGDQICIAAHQAVAVSIPTVTGIAERCNNRFEVTPL